MADPEDTEVLLALLSSMVNGPIPSQEQLLCALMDAQGDVVSAAASINSLKSKGPPSNNQGVKRKRGDKLDGWVINKKTQKDSANSKRPVSQAQGSSTMQLDRKILSFKTEEPIEILSDDEGSDLGPEDTVANQPSSSSTTQKSIKPVSLMSILKQAPTLTKQPARLPPRTLGTPALVAQHTPCTLHYSILPAELACRLYYAMLKEATSWSKNKWWLFDRVVESPHRTSFYARNTVDMEDKEMQEAAQYWYNGRLTPPPNTFVPEMEEACEIIERTVNEDIMKRGTRYPMEWPTSAERPWRANVAAANCYTGSKETVGFHSDQLTYLGPCPTIASLSLGTTRTFRLREVVPQSEKQERNAQTFNIPVVHNSLLIMHASCQERFKHAVPPQQTIDAFHPPFPPHLDDNESTLDMESSTTSRINITFRFYRPDFSAKTIPRCHCDIPTILRPDMKHRDGLESKMDEVAKMRYFWMCYGGAQNDGKGCSFFQILDFEKERRGEKFMRSTD